MPSQRYRPLSLLTVGSICKRSLGFVQKGLSITWLRTALYVMLERSGLSNPPGCSIRMTWGSLRLLVDTPSARYSALITIGLTTRKYRREFWAVICLEKTRAGELTYGNACLLSSLTARGKIVL